MIPTIETICEDLKAGKITVGEAISWLHQHAEGAANERRDMFAAMALQGMMAYFNHASGDFHTNSSFEKNAKYAYDQADAMLACRSTGDAHDS